MNLTSFVRNLFKTNSQKLAAFHELEAEFAGLNRGLETIQAEKDRLARACETARQKMLESFSVQAVKDFSLTAVESDNFAAAANAASTLFVHTISQREQAPRVREICHAALGACRDVLQGKLAELERADKAHFEKLGLDGAAVGESGPVSHLRGVLGSIEQMQKSTRGENLFSWPNIREFLKSLADS